ncbi:DUF4861 domain-containing protein [Prevotella sp. P2-180]|uniref:DUF4861 domain-containing protein n=1 Tax=Prevotella sp. P2-180 TaxID=2024224 RepID=UPI000B96C402|nr:DUF4861 domain-containing protein [Prevotella sp. P2-180]OYP62705.1 hypothetical protein CIK98_13295 [Prevotella sp. P2-180]
MKRIATTLMATATTLAIFAQAKQVTVTNNSDFNREAEPIVISINEKADYKSAVVSSDGNTLPYQLEDIDDNGHYDQICFITSLKKKEKKQFLVTLHKQEAEQTLTPQVYAEMMLTNKKIKSQNKQDLYISSLTVDNGTNPYWMLHHHGPAFENDMVAYRIYFDERQTIDIYGKNRKALELKETQFYPDKEQKANGYGDDVLWVGKTFGLGALRGWADNQPQMLLDVDKRTMEIVACGPLRTIVKVVDKGWNPFYPEKCDNAKRIDMTTLYTLSAGRRDCAVDVMFKGDIESLKLATGLINVKNSEEYSDGKGLRGCWGTDWPVSEKDSAGHKRETVGLGICIPADNIIKELPANSDNYPYVVKPALGEIPYHITFASDNETFPSSFHTPASFFEYLRQWKRQIESPVTITTKDVFL